MIEQTIQFTNMQSLRKILNVSQTRATDAHTISHNSISSMELMENASKAFVRALDLQLLTNKKIVVVCGPGNNGGDGFAICRLLREQGLLVSAVLIQFRDELSADCLANKAKIHDVIIVRDQAELPDFNQYDVIIDAMLGSGLNSPARGLVAATIDAINDANKEVYAVDVPSGLFCDGISPSQCSIRATHVISFQRPKLSFFLPESGPYIQYWQSVDIGLDEEFIQQQESNHFVLDERVYDLVPTRPRQSHKGTYGHALVIAGSYGKMGAAVLASRSCLRSGVGLLSSYVPACGYEIMQISVPESMCQTDSSEKLLATPPDTDRYDAIGVGPGIGTDPATMAMLATLITNTTKPLVLDADAINLVAANQALLAQLPANTILTPHIKEFDRLVGPCADSEERLSKLQQFCIKHQCIVVLKDAYTCVASSEGKLYFNTTGNQGMATGGSGDVLTGIVTGLLAQNYDPLVAAVVGVYFHGKAGNLALTEKSYCALIASDIIEELRIESNAEINASLHKRG